MRCPHLRYSLRTNMRYESALVREISAQFGIGVDVAPVHSLTVSLSADAKGMSGSLVPSCASDDCISDDKKIFAHLTHGASLCCFGREWSEPFADVVAGTPRCRCQLGHRRRHAHTASARAGTTRSDTSPSFIFHITPKPTSTSPGAMV